MTASTDADRAIARSAPTALLWAALVLLVPMLVGVVLVVLVVVVAVLPDGPAR